jgi:thioester reductase-like protein
MRSYGLWSAALGERIVPMTGDLASPMLGLTHDKFEELAGTVDAIYHNGASVNLYYPYSVLKAPNVLSTEELLRMTSYGRSKSLHFVSTLHVNSTRARDASRLVITEKDPRPDPRTLFDGYAQSKWVAENLVESAAARGIPVVTYRPSQIIGHSRTGAASVADFVPSFIRGCMQLGCVPDVVLDNQLYLAPVDYVSRSIVAISRRTDVFGGIFNLTSPSAIPLREVLEHLVTFDPTLRRIPYEAWKSRLNGDPDNALARYVGSFADRIPEEKKPSVRAQFDCTETLKVVEAAGIDRPQITPQLFHTYFAYLAEHTAARAAVRAD